MNSKRQQKFTPMSFLLRLGFALAMVLLTFNPSEYSFFHWVKGGFANSNLGPAHLLAGVILAIGWAIYLRATFRALGPVGLVLAGALVGALVWLFIDLGWLTADSTKAITWIALVGISVLLGIGLSWSHVRRRVAGQYDVDDV